jgi:hypothetical protein
LEKEIAPGDLLVEFSARLAFCVVSLLDKAEFLGQFDRASLSWENRPTRERPTCRPQPKRSIK